MTAYNVKIDHFSMILPERIVGNEEIFALIRKKKQELGLEIDETRLDWRAFGATTMIQERRIFPEGSDIHKISEATLTKALAEAGWKADELDFIIVSTISKSPHVGALSTPSVACIVQEAIGAWNAFAYDSSAACSGWLYAAQQAIAFIHSKMAKKGAVICIDMPHNGRCIDFSNEKTAPLTGEVSTATLFSYSEEPRIHEIKTYANKPDIKSDLITVGLFDLPQLPFSLNGKLVYKLGIQEMLRMTKENEAYTMEKFGKKPDYYVYHQANGAMLMRILEEAVIDPAKNLYNVDRLANTIGATIPSVLAEKWSSLQKGSFVSTIAFGAGATMGKLLFIR